MTFGMSRLGLDRGRVGIERPPVTARPDRHPGPVAESISPWEDAKLAMTEFGNWIKNADTKVAVQAAALGVVITAAGSKADLFRRALSDPAAGCRAMLVGPLLLLLGAIVATGMYLYRALAPRTAATEWSRFSWPSIAAAAQPPEVLDRRSTLREAWSQNYALARIADEKFAACRNALRCFGLTLILFAACIGVATWQASG
ncbi:hypothetical protein [Nocardia sp. BMG111209]|uniref:hypothetical protein n=1 Tax=Nocardia sp. BMG111209 TaxID=1160137 RepID=UPI0003A97C55|nr:hypothetical protein [Nocardia sp. BMG111209]